MQPRMGIASATTIPFHRVNLADRVGCRTDEARAKIGSPLDHLRRLLETRTMMMKSCIASESLERSFNEDEEAKRDELSLFPGWESTGALPEETFTDILFYRCPDTTTCETAETATAC